MRLCALFVMCVFLTCCTSNQQTSSKYVRTPAQALLSVKQLTINTHGSGTAFPVKQDKEGTYFATAKHCVFNQDGTKAIITIDGIECTIMDWSVEFDVAVFYAKGFLDLKPFKLGNVGLQLRDEVFTVGWHFGYQLTFDSGNITFLSPEGFLVHNSPLNPGCSGGPTMVYRDGQLITIGVNSAILTARGGFNGVAYSTSIKYVKDILDRIK